MSVADPHKLILSGENPFLRMSDKDGDPNSTDASFWRILFCPAGPGHVLYIKSELTHAHWRIYSDNIAMARWLQKTVQGMLNDELLDTAIPVTDATFDKTGDARDFWTERAVSHDEEVALTWYDIGEPLLTGEHIQPRTEPEIVFVMGADVSGSRVTASDVLAATSGVAVGIEVLDSRYRDYRFTMPDVVADNASAGRYVVGAPVPVRGIDLRLVGVVLEHRGEVVATASGAASLGHPAAAVAWLVRSLASAGEGLRAGDIVLSGGLTAAVPVVPGDVVVVTIDRIGCLELACH